TRTLKVVVVVASTTTKRQRNRQAETTAACATDTLLVVEADRRHVCHPDRLQRTDVDAGLHRGGHAQEINSHGVVDFAVEKDLLEQSLAIAARSWVCLPCELL